MRPTGPSGDTWYCVTTLPTWKVLVPATEMDIEMRAFSLSDCNRSAARPPQPERAGWSGSEVCQCNVWSLCEKSCGGTAAVRFRYSSRVTGATSGPTLATSAARPELNSPCRPWRLGCRPHARESPGSPEGGAAGWSGSSALCGSAREARAAAYCV